MSVRTRGLATPVSDPAPSIAGVERLARPSRPAALLAGLLAFAVLAQGAFYPVQALVLAAGTTWLALRERPKIDDEPRPAVVAFLGLASALAASLAANGFPPESVRPVAILAIAASTLLAVRGVVARDGSAALLRALAAIGGLAGAAGLAGVAFHRFPLASHEAGVWRAASTLTYTNAAGSLLALALPAALLVARSDARARWRLAAFAIVAALLATLSRGGALAGVVTVAGAAALGGRALARPLVRPALGAVVAFAGLVPSVVHDGARPLPALAALAAGAIVAGAPLRERGERRVLRAAVAAAVAACLLAPAVLLWSDAGRIVTSRIGPDSAVRTLYWRAALGAAQDPVLGTGPGTFQASTVAAGEDVSITFAHNELLQAYVETGAVGLGAMLAAIGLLARWAWRRRAVADRALWACGVAACAGFLAQGLLDFVWHIPALVAVAFAWLAIATSDARPTEGRSR